MFAQLEAALGKLGAVVERETEFKQIYARDSQRVCLEQDFLHGFERAGNHRHLDHHVRDKPLAHVHEPEGLLRYVAVFVELHAEAYLGQTRIIERLRRTRIQEISAGVKAYVAFGVKLACTRNKLQNHIFMQEWFPARYGQAVELGPMACGVFQLCNDVALMRQEVLVVILVGIEAEVAVARAAQVNEEGAGGLAGTACQACGGYPVEPKRGLGVLAVAAALPGAQGAPLPRARLGFLEGDAETFDRCLEVVLHLPEGLCILVEIHGDQPSSSMALPSNR